MISAWKRELVKRAGELFARGNTAPAAADGQKVIDDLHRKIRQLQVERDFHRPRAFDAAAEFATIRLRLLKLGTRVIETVSRVRLAFAVACPDATLIRYIAVGLMPTGP